MTALDAPPDRLGRGLEAVGNRIVAASAAVGAPVRWDWGGVLTQRGRAPRGRTTAGGSGRLLRCADGWVAAQLARPDDHELLDAWFALAGVGERDRPAVDPADPWGAVAAAVRGVPGAALAEAAGLVGLAVGVLGERAPDPHDGARVLHRRHRPVTRRPRVVDLSALWAGPLCGAILAASGAEVTKVEAAGRPDGARAGDPDLFASLDRLKANRTLDLATAAGRAELAELVRGADVVVEASRPRALWMLWLAAQRAARVAARRWGSGAAAALVAVPLALAVALTVPGLWGIGGRLEPVTFPAGWAAARAEIRQHPGTVVALPWNEYPSLSFAGGRTVFNPTPDYLGGDVISSYDPLFDPARPIQEQVDHRSEVVDDLVAGLADGTPVSTGLARLGVRWVFVAQESDDLRYQRLADDPGLRIAFRDRSVTLYEVTGWRGPAVAADGSPHTLRRRYAPLLRTDAPAGSVLSMAGAPGWVQGWGTPAQVTTDGRLRITGSGGVVWFWPAPLLVVLDLVLVAGALILVARGRWRENTHK